MAKSIELPHARIEHQMTEPQRRRMTSRFSLVVALTLCSMVSWSVSLFLPAADLGPATAYGWQFLIHGWRGVAAFDIGGLSWLANPLLIGAWLSLLARADRLRTTALAWSALAAALTSLLFNAANRGEGGLTIENFAIGFYLWLASVALQVAAATLQRRQR